MAARDFVAVSWNPGQLIEEDVLDQMNNNINWVRDQMVDGLYQHRLGGTTDTGLKILCGTIGIPANPKAQGVGATVNFAKMFTPNSYPSVTTGVISNWTPFVFCNIYGIGTVMPDHRGFITSVWIADHGKTAGRMTSSTYVSWIAMGY